LANSLLFYVLEISTEAAVKISEDQLDGLRKAAKKLRLVTVNGAWMRAGTARTIPERHERPTFGQLPHHWNPIIVRANAFRAMPLLTAITYQMGAGRFRVLITSETWALAGSPRTRAQRRAMLAALNRVPSIIRLSLSDRTGAKYTARKGIWFNRTPPRARGALLTYRDYLNAPEWRERREHRLELSGFRCEYMTDGGRCTETECLEVHHLRYDTLGREADADLRVLCARHHDLTHGFEGGGS
jgi:hypothetical protein